MTPSGERAPGTPAAGEPAAGGADLQAWPRRPQRLATAVVEDLVDRIVGGDLAVGSTLPIEPVLCEMFAVSRTVIREAVKGLEAMRLVHVQQGHGTTVRGVDEWDLLNPVVLAASIRHDAELSILEDLVAVRRALESQMSGQAATLASADQLKQIQATLDRLEEEVDDPARFLRADLAFHDAIMVASGNRMGRAIVHTINAEAFRSMRYIGEPSRAHCLESNVGHRAIFDSLLAKDADAADRAMNEHIQSSWMKRRPQPAGKRRAARR